MERLQQLRIEIYCVSPKISARARERYRLAAVDRLGPCDHAEKWGFRTRHRGKFAWPYRTKSTSAPPLA